MRVLKTTLVVLCFALTSAVASAADRYYVIAFSWEGNPPIARLSHSFATFVKVSQDYGVEEVEEFSISWMPASLRIKIFARPETGRNLTIAETFDYCKAHGGQILGLGPYEISKDLYEAALRQLRRLESGRVAYKAADLRQRWRGYAFNCYYAVTDAAPREMINLGRSWGHTTCVPMLEHYGPWLMNAAKTHDEIIDRVGLRDRAVKFRRLQDIAPNSPVLLEAIAAQKETY